jgi:predicted permease
MFRLDLFRRRRYERELDDELQFDLECRTEANLRAGRTPAEARRQALLSLGPIDLTKEECRDGRSFARLESVAQDLRYGVRALRHNPAFTLVAVFSLAAGIGANSAVFSFIDAVFTRPMPVPRVSEILHISTTSPQFRFTGVSGADYLDYSHAASVAGLAAVDYRGPVLTIGDVPESTYAEVVSDNFFTLLGVRAALGRTFQEEANPSPAIVLGHRFFQAKFGADPRVIGHAVRMNGRMVTVIGVAPATFRGTRNDMSADLWVPFSTWNEPWELHDRRIPEFTVIGRLRSGNSVAQAGQEFAGIAANLARAYRATNQGRTVLVESDRAHRLHAAENPLSLIPFALVTAVLLLASLNVAMLLLARAETRRREMAVRLTLGAGRFRLVRQLLTEASLLAAFGAVAGIALGGLLIRLVPAALHLDRIAGDTEFLLDSRVLLFSLAVAAGSGLLFGVVPAFVSARADVSPELKAAAASAGTAVGRARARNVLVAVQVGVSLVLVVMGMLLAQSLRRAAEADLGFRDNNVLVFAIPNLADDAAKSGLLYREVVSEVRALPGVRSAAVAMRPPLSGSGGGRTEKILLPGPRPEPMEVGTSVVGSGYFSLLRTRLLGGREFDDHDTFSSRKVAVINETGARRFWPGENPIGKIFRSGGADGPIWEIVGVSADARVNSISETARPYLYFPFAQMPSGDLNLLVSTGPSPETLVKPVRERLRAVNKDLVVYSSFTLVSLVESALDEFRLPAQLAAGLALVGVLLAAVGLYGVISYFVNARTRETGIRMALGARAGDILSSVLAHAARLAACGIALGIALTLAAGRGLSSLLYGVSPSDWSALAAASALMLAVALAAGFIPARRAARTDPALTLRQE